MRFFIPVVFIIIANSSYSQVRTSSVIEYFPQENTLKSFKVNGKVVRFVERKYSIENSSGAEKGDLLSRTDLVFDNGLLTEREDSVEAGITKAAYTYDSNAYLTEEKVSDFEGYEQTISFSREGKVLKAKSKEADGILVIDLSEKNEWISQTLYEDATQHQNQSFSEKIGYSYNPNGQISQLVYEAFGDIYMYRFNYDAKGNVVLISRLDPETKKVLSRTGFQYEYDSLENWKTRIQYELDNRNAKTFEAVITREYWYK